MIVRDTGTHFIFIEQHHHALVARKIIEKWENVLWEASAIYGSVLYAVEQHDRAWRLFDAEPFWNDIKQAPYQFVDFPNSAKIVMYTKGIDEVEKVDAYAAVLCSAHYSSFLESSTNAEEKEFVELEKGRQQRLLQKLNGLASNQVAEHLALLKLADNLSLYLCLNHPGVTKEAEHFFFKKGIPVASSVAEWKSGAEKLTANWKNQSTIEIGGIPYVKPFSVAFQEKNIMKERIAEKGLITAYTEAPYEMKEVTFIVT
ncbi:MAG TPA: DUF3891 family protein [Pseudogracilibacillus sp.]|nr:DUF3891 family protein [Pseudogracilibacillus sp.]